VKASLGLTPCDVCRFDGDDKIRLLASVLKDDGEHAITFALAVSARQTPVETSDRRRVAKENEGLYSISLVSMQRQRTASPDQVCDCQCRITFRLPAADR
jgi:hypothetical protein